MDQLTLISVGELTQLFVELMTDKLAFLGQEEQPKTGKVAANE